MNPTQRTVILFFLKAHWRMYMGIFSLSLLVAALEASTVFVVVPLFSDLLGAGRSSESLGLPGRLLNAGLLLIPIGNTVTRICLLILGLSALKFLITLAVQYYIARSSGATLYEIKRRLLEAYAKAPYDYFLDTKQGRMAYLISTASGKLAHLILKIPELGIELIRILALAALLLWLNTPVALGLLGFALAFDRLARAASAGLSYTYGRGRLEASSDQAVVFNEFLNGIKQLRIFGVSHKWLDRFNQASRKFVQFYIKDTVLLTLPKPLMEMSAITLIFGTLLTLNWFYLEKVAATLPLMAAFTMAAIKALPSIAAIGRARLEILSELADAESVHSVLTQPFPSPRSGKRRFLGLASEIRFEQVRFAYKECGELLKGVDMEFSHGKISAIVGDSGSGKTTLLNLLLGLYEPSSGRILIDGVDLRDIDLRSWLNRVAVVTQDPFIFHASVAENIVFGRDGFTQADLEKAARMAEAHEFIAAFPEGYSTVVGERGMKLSGGQQQRIAIARAVLGDPAILILDEATSSLDSLSEAAVQEALEVASKGRTVIQVAHRLSTISASDKIIVLHQGRVTEEGTHKQLLLRGGRYCALQRQIEVTRT